MIEPILWIIVSLVLLYFGAEWLVRGAADLAARNPRMAALAEELIRKYEFKLTEHYDYVRATSIDPPEILNWRWKARPAGK